MSYMKSRQRKFDMWWKKNHHKKQGQVWLCKSAKRIAFAYNLPPSAFDDVRFICKRFFSSEHMRLRKEDAWKLYKLCNPLHTERLKRLQTTAEHLDASIVDWQTKTKTRYAIKVRKYVANTCTHKQRYT